MKYFKHPLSSVESSLIGENTKIWQFVVVLKDASIGENTNICSHCFIENKVRIGNNVTIKAGVYLWDGINIEDDVFIGPNVVFTNDVFPRSKQYKEPSNIIIKRGASIGANSTVLAGITIGEYAMTGIGSVITKNLKSYGLYYGNPAEHKGWVDESGDKLTLNSSTGKWVSKGGTVFSEIESGLVPSHK